VRLRFWDSVVVPRGATQVLLVNESGGCAASSVVAPLLDGPFLPLVIAHRSAAAWQLADGSGRVVACLQPPGGLRLPHGVVMPCALPSGGPAPVSVGAGRLRVAGREHRVGRWWSPPQPRLPDLADRVDERAAVALLRSWRSRLGAGDGLTPYADDVLCGSLLALLSAGHPAGAELALAVDAVDLEAATTATSAGLLRQAAHGRCIAVLACYLRSLTGGEQEQRRCSVALEAVGRSSGRGMAEGVQQVLPDNRASRYPAASTWSRRRPGVAA
jgi:hypothetical protein